MRTNIFLFVAFGTLIFGSCLTQKNTAQKDRKTIEDIAWRLVTLGEQRVPDSVNGKIPQLTLLSEQHRYSATAGCNGIGGEYKIEGDKITFTKGMSTMMACPDMSVERELTKVFDSTLSFTLNKDKLILKNDKDSVIASFSKL